MPRLLPTRVVKVQIPLADSDRGALPLVYDQYCVHYKAQPVPKVILDHMASTDNKVKGYYHALWNGILEAWVFMMPPRPAPWQSW